MEVADCIDKFRSSFLFVLDVVYCNATWDGILCWPPTPSGETVYQLCPQGKGIDSTKLASRKCSTSGLWEGKTPLDFSRPQGWTNYSECFTVEAKALLSHLYSHGEYEGRMKLMIAMITRLMEMIGLSLSFLTLLVSLSIFLHFRSLWNSRTKIHMNLFFAVLVHVFIRLLIYIDQYVVRSNSTKERSRSTTIQGIDNTPLLCESLYIILEYTRTAMFMWMFLEGWYLNKIVTYAVFQKKFNFAAYYCVGWGFPGILTLAWVMTTSLYPSLTECWWNYNLMPFFWIIEGPRLAAIIANLLFLFNIIRVLVTKLRRNTDNEVLQIRKAVRAAMILLPLLGVTNIANMLGGVLNTSAFVFGLWALGSHILSSFQGFLIALFYCFLNGEVRSTLTRRNNIIFVQKAVRKIDVQVNLNRSSSNVPRVTHRIESELKSSFCSCFPVHFPTRITQV